MPEALYDCVQDEVARRLDCGARLAEVDREVVEATPGLSEDERAALWLFAWSYEPGARHSARALRSVAL
jgi:hypothetical protein